jgi:hypothetical protein
MIVSSIFYRNEVYSTQLYMKKLSVTCAPIIFFGILYWMVGIGDATLYVIFVAVYLLFCLIFQVIVFIILFNFHFFHNFHIFSLFNLHFFRIFRIFSLYNLLFFCIFHIISLLRNKSKLNSEKI